MYKGDFGSHKKRLTEFIDKYYYKRNKRQIYCIKNISAIFIIDVTTNKTANNVARQYFINQLVEQYSTRHCARELGLRDWHHCKLPTDKILTSLPESIRSQLPDSVFSGFYIHFFTKYLLNTTSYLSS